MGKAMSIVTGLGAGAGLMYLMDPDRGRRRRALMRDKFSSSLSQSRHGLEKTWRDLENRGHGLVSGARKLFSRGAADEDVLVERVRSRIGHAVSHPHAITVRSAGPGRVVLEGPVLERELNALLSAVSSVRGVRHVENRLAAHPVAEGIPALQGGSTRTGERWEFMQTNWTPAARMLAGVAGGVLLVDGFRRGGFFGVTQGLLGACLLARAGTNAEMQRIVGLGGRRGVDIQKTLNILAPVEEVYAFWSNYQNFPRFMTHIKEVRDLGNGRSHWTAAGPAGVPVAWDAELTERIPNQILAWKSTPESRIENAGIVRFDSNADGSTRISIRTTYNPPAGMLGHAVASLFGADTKKEIDDDLVRLKSLLEFGKTRAHGSTVRKEEFGAGLRRPTPGLA